MFKEERDSLQFTWDMIGDIKLGRPNLGNYTDVAIYRLMQYTLRDVMIKELGVEKANQIFFDAGKLAGEEFYKNLVDKCDDTIKLFKQIEDLFIKYKIGIIRIENIEQDSMNIILTIAEDLDCSGLPVCDEEVCTYDEGFLAGILKEHTGEDFTVKEIDCWCSGARICRFKATKNK